MDYTIPWSRQELKNRSKKILHIHYWRIVLVALFLALLGNYQQIPMDEVEEFSQNQASSIWETEESGTGLLPFISLYKHIQDEMEGGSHFGKVAFGMIAGTAVFLTAVSSLSGILLATFVTNPLRVGARRFFIRSFESKPQLREIFHAFENHYRNVVSVMFLRNLFTVLWCLLLFVPGIVKSYEYCMIPFLLAEHPDMGAKEAFGRSREMMDGHKWNAFILQVSFIGWEILSGITFGILGLFFVRPYKELAFTALYRKLSGGDAIPHNIYYDGMEEEI